MKRFLLSLLILLPLSLFSQTPDWRFGFEYDEIEPNFILGVFESNHDTILHRLASVTASQSVRGAINVNGGGWHNMQANENAPIDFDKTDDWVNRFQKYGFEFIFYLVCNAPWAYADNPTCIDVLSAIPEECAPDSLHWQDWYDYVYAVVERYDGDGVDDMPGLIKPIRYLVMEQEVYMNGSAGGDPSEFAGKGFWEDNMVNLIRLHEVTYQAIQAADSSGNTKLVGSGGLWFDLYADFPDYPDVHGPTVQARLNGNNLGGVPYHQSWDSLSFLISSLGNDSGGVKCDYIGWHPHMGWKSTDQSFKYIKSLAPGKPIFVDDMWSIMFTTTQPFDGFAQFIGADSMEGDFPIASIPSYQALEDQMNNGDSLTVAWFNAKTARKAVKNFVTAFGEGAERVCFSMTNDPNPQMPFYNQLTGPWRWSGMMGHKNTQYQPKPVFYTMKLLVEKLHDFTSVTQVPVSNNPYTRVYRFERERGTACLIAWSEAVNNPVNPAIPNGETVDIPVNSDSLLLTEIITEANITQGNQSWETSSSGNFSVQLGFTPIILEETLMGTDLEVFKEKLNSRIYPNPTSGMATLQLTATSHQSLYIELLDIHGKEITRIFHGQLNQGQTDLIIDLRAYVAGIYFLRIVGENVSEAHKVIKVD